MRSALTLEEIAKLMKESGCDPAMITRVRALYAAAYKEGYADGKTDAEEAAGEEDCYYDE